MRLENLNYKFDENYKKELNTKHLKFIEDTLKFRSEEGRSKKRKALRNYTSVKDLKISE